MNDKKTFRDVLKENKVKFPDKYQYYHQAGTLFTVLSIFLFFALPAVKYTNGSSIAEPKYYSIFSLILAKGGENAWNLVVLMLIASLTAFFAQMFIALYCGSFFVSPEKKQLVKNSNKENKKANLIKLIVGLAITCFAGLILVSVVASLMTELPNTVKRWDEFTGNNNWFVEGSWGPYLVIICMIMGFACPLFLLIRLLVFKSMYDAGNITEQGLIRLFQKNKIDESKTAVIEQKEHAPASLKTQIEELYELKEKGLITEEEYKEKKTDILKNHNPNQ